jgi:hypothetical protein
MNISKSCIALFIFFALQYSHAQAAGHDPACEAAWDQSSARASCSGLNWTTQNPVNMCNFSRRCAGTGTHLAPGAHAGQYRVEGNNTDQYVSFPLQDVPQLSNCNGILKVGSC